MAQANEPGLQIPHQRRSEPTMPSIQWTTEFILLACATGLILATLGFLLATVLQGRKFSELQTQLRLTETAVEQTNNAQQRFQSQCDQLQTTLHAKEVAETELTTRLSHAQHTDNP
jgi:DNA recombination protein RmuC